MDITRVAQTKPFNNPHGVQTKRILDAPQATVIHMAMNPGEHLSPHATHVDVFFYVLQGEPEEDGSTGVNGQPILSGQPFFP